MEVENYRVDGKVRQRILHYLGRVDADQPVSSKWITKKTNAIVQDSGMARISISRKLKGMRVPVVYRYPMPDQSCNPTPGMKKKEMKSSVQPP